MSWRKIKCWFGLHTKMKTYYFASEEGFGWGWWCLFCTASSEKGDENEQS